MQGKTLSAIQWVYHLIAEKKANDDVQRCSQVRNRQKTGQIQQYRSNNANLLHLDNFCKGISNYRKTIINFFFT